jgi:hypothetical protein
MRFAHLLPILGLLATSSLVYAAKGHTHGEGQLDVVIDKETITLNLELPLDVAVGFERAPKNDKEKAALAAAGKALNDAAALWQPTAAAGCTLSSKDVKIPFIGATDHQKHAHEGESHHADIEASYSFRCTTPAALKGIETTLFRSFPRLYRLETQRAGPSGQGKQRLSPKTPALYW